MIEKRSIHDKNLLILSIILTLIFLAPGTSCAQSINRFGVEIYVAGDPNCDVLKPFPDIRATISPFQPEVRLGDIIGELARLALGSGANVVHEIRFISVKPFEGAVVTAKAEQCSGSWTTTMNRPLLMLSVKSDNGEIYGFPNSEILSENRSISNSKITGPVILNEETLEKVILILTSQSSFDLSSPQRSCPFVPKFGFRFVNGQNEAWWLISPLCQTSMLIKKSDDWRTIPQIKMTGGAIAALEQIFLSYSGINVK